MKVIVVDRRPAGHQAHRQCQQITCIAKERENIRKKSLKLNLIAVLRKMKIKKNLQHAIVKNCLKIGENLYIF